MVTTLKKKQHYNLSLFLSTNRDEDFYYTLDNKRFYIKSIRDIKRVTKNSPEILIHEEGSKIEGTAFIWKGIGAGVSRKYIKMLATDEKVADKLLSILLWNFNGKEIFIKLNKTSKLLNLFLHKGFTFFHDRGKEVLLIKKMKDW